MDDLLDLALHVGEERGFAILGASGHIQGMQPCAFPIVQTDRANHRLPVPIITGQQTGAIHAYRDRGHLRRLDGNGVIPVLLLERGNTADDVTDVLNMGPGEGTTMVFGQIDLHLPGTGIRVF